MDQHPTPFPVKKSRGTMKPSKPAIKKDMKTQPSAEPESSSHGTKEGSEFEFQNSSTEPYPTPYPLAKSRGTAKPIAKPSKPLNKDLKTQPTSQTQSRTKRTFGVARNPNIPTEKKPEPKPLKPSCNPIKPIKKSTQLSVSNNTKKTSDEKKNKKELTVQFEEDEVAMQTPTVTKKVSLEGESSNTPYFTAENYSKYRNIDPLETSSYWLNQIKLAESVEKHLVSAAFFRLALYCDAEPKEMINSELKKYMEKHNDHKAMSNFADIFSLSLEIGYEKEELYSESTEEETENIDYFFAENYSSNDDQSSDSSLISLDGLLESSSDSLDQETDSKGKQVAKYGKRSSSEKSLSFRRWLTKDMQM